MAVHPARLTHSFISASEQFVVNIPVVDLIGPVHHAGMITGRDNDKFATVGLEPEESTVVEAPRVAGCAAYIECQVRDRASMGDHDLFVADIVSVSADDESFDGHWNVEVDAGRLLHHLGADRYGGWREHIEHNCRNDERGSLEIRSSLPTALQPRKKYKVKSRPALGTEIARSSRLTASSNMLGLSLSEQVVDFGCDMPNLSLHSDSSQT